MGFHVKQEGVVCSKLNHVWSIIASPSRMYNRWKTSFIKFTSLNVFKNIFFLSFLLCFVIVSVLLGLCGRPTKVGCGRPVPCPDAMLRLSHRTPIPYCVVLHLCHIIIILRLCRAAYAMLRLCRATHVSCKSCYAYAMLRLCRATHVSNNQAR